jgi:hypothetical protein
VLLGELLLMDDALRREILAGSDTPALEKVAAAGGLHNLRLAADSAVSGVLTSSEEIERILGPAPLALPSPTQAGGEGNQTRDFATGGATSQGDKA